MPKKTRKQKEHARLRRQKEHALLGVNSGSERAVKREFEFDFNSLDLGVIKKSDFKKVDNSFYSYTNSFVKRDLTKTVIIATGILVFEIMIYWAWFK